METIDCACGKRAKRILPKTASASYNALADDTGKPQNTGVPSLDYNADRAIGESSFRTWQKISLRNAQKHDLLAENPDASPEDIARLPIENDGRMYRILSDTEKEDSRKRREALEAAKATR